MPSTGSGKPGRNQWPSVCGSKENIAANDLKMFLPIHTSDTAFRR